MEGIKDPFVLVGVCRVQSDNLRANFGVLGHFGVIVLFGEDGWVIVDV